MQLSKHILYLVVQIGKNYYIGRLNSWRQNNAEAVLFIIKVFNKNCFLASKVAVRNIYSVMLLHCRGDSKSKLF